MLHGAGSRAGQPPVEVEDVGRAKRCDAEEGHSVRLPHSNGFHRTYLELVPTVFYFNLIVKSLLAFLRYISSSAPRGLGCACKRHAGGWTSR